MVVERTELRTTINGIYYLRDDDPLDWADIGSLLKNQPYENESTCCGMFINFHFAEEGLYIGNSTIFNIYYHFWQKSFPFGEYEIGYSTSVDHTAGFNESIWIDTNDCICEVNNYRLVQAMQFTNPNIAVFKDNDIFNFTIKFFGPNPYVLCNPNQYSFIILNLEDNATLQNYDRDDDLLNDYDELFVYYTNPYDSDSDNDGVSDFIEKQIGSNPNDYLDNIGLNTRPETPILKGPSNGKVGKENEYKFSASDPDGNDIFYYIKWGDEQIEKWIGNYKSGEEVVFSHIWNEIGEYIITVKVKDIYGAESNWAELTVSISKNRLFAYKNFYSLFDLFPNLFQIFQKIKYNY
jgi:hypothetical protein